MKKRQLFGLLALLATLLLAAGCAGGQSAETAPAPEYAQSGESDAQDAGPARTGEENQTPEEANSEEKSASPVADPSQMAPVEEVVEEGMTPVYASDLNDGTYEVTVDSSSSMFRITRCRLTVSEGKMTAVLSMGGTGYLRVYLGTGEEAAAADEADCIPYEEQADGTHTFTLPVEALDQGIAYAVFCKNKELWYDRTLVFRADSLPLEAFRADTLQTVERLGLADGGYTVEVRLEGGSGKAGVASPAALRVEDGTAWATLVWSSPNYDYMKVDGTRYDPIQTGENAVFEIPVAVFDRKLTVYADTTAMSTPHEIEYTLFFDAASVTPAE